MDSLGDFHLLQKYRQLVATNTDPEAEEYMHALATNNEASTIQLCYRQKALEASRDLAFKQALVAPPTSRIKERAAARGPIRASDQRVAMAIALPTTKGNGHRSTLQPPESASNNISTSMSDASRGRVPLTVQNTSDKKTPNRFGVETPISVAFPINIRRGPEALPSGDADKSTIPVSAPPSPFAGGLQPPRLDVTANTPAVNPLSPSKLLGLDDAFDIYRVHEQSNGAFKREAPPKPLHDTLFSTNHTNDAHFAQVHKTAMQRMRPQPYEVIGPLLRSSPVNPHDIRRTIWDDLAIRQQSNPLLSISGDAPKNSLVASNKKVTINKSHLAHMRLPPSTSFQGKQLSKQAGAMVEERLRREELQTGEAKGSRRGIGMVHLGSVFGARDSDPVKPLLVLPPISRTSAPTTSLAGSLQSNSHLKSDFATPHKSLPQKGSLGTPLTVPGKAHHQSRGGTPKPTRFLVSPQAYDRIVAMGPATQFDALMEVVTTAIESNLYLSYDARERDEAALAQRKKEAESEDTQQRNFLLFTQRVRTDVGSLTTKATAALFVGFRACVAKAKLHKQLREREAPLPLGTSVRGTGRRLGSSMSESKMGLDSPSPSQRVPLALQSTAAIVESFTPSDWLLSREDYLAICSAAGLAPSTSLWVRPSTFGICMSFFGILSAVCPNAVSSLTASVVELITVRPPEVPGFSHNMHRGSRSVLARNKSQSSMLRSTSSPRLRGSVSHSLGAAVAPLSLSFAKYPTDLVPSTMPSPVSGLHMSRSVSEEGSGLEHSGMAVPATANEGEGAPTMPPPSDLLALFDQFAEPKLTFSARYGSQLESSMLGPGGRSRSFMAQTVGSRASIVSGMGGTLGGTGEYDADAIDLIFAKHHKVLHLSVLPKALDMYFTVMYPRLASFRPQSDKLPLLVRTYDTDRDGVLSAAEFATMVIKERFFRYKLK